MIEDADTIARLKDEIAVLVEDIRRLTRDVMTEQLRAAVCDAHLHALTLTDAAMLDACGRLECGRLRRRQYANG